MDALGNPTGFVLTAGQAPDLEGANVLRKHIEARMVVADKAHDAQQRVPLLQAGKAVAIPSTRTRAVQREYDRHLCRAPPDRELPRTTDAVPGQRHAL